MKKLIITLMITLMLASCATQTINVKNRVPEKPTDTNMNFFWLGGIFQSKKIDAVKICNGSENISRVIAKQTTLDGLFSILTAGIFTPRHTIVYC